MRTDPLTLWESVSDIVEKLIEPADDTLRDVQEGRRQRDAALASVESRANVIWKQRFGAVVDDFAQQGRTFTSEDVTAVVGLPPSGSHNAIGAMTRASAVRNGYRKVGRRQAVRVTRHANEIAVWGPSYASGVM